MKISVLVPTYRRPADLKRCLAALRAQTLPPDEVLVVARPEDEATQRRLAVEANGHNRFALRVVETGAGGQVAALNRGLEAASGDIVAITDDDAAPRVDWVARIAAAFEGDAKLGALGGRDWVHEKGRVLDASREVVGRIARSGKIIGNHHLGVGPAREVKAPADAKIVDLPGMTLMPGLIDAHSHILLHPYSETVWNDQVAREALSLRVARATNHLRSTVGATDVSGFTATFGSVVAPVTR